MPKNPPIADVVEEMFQSVLASPQRQRRLLSKTFWGGFGFKTRTRDRIEQVKTSLRQRSLLVNHDEEVFGTEGKNEWIVLTYVEPKPPVVTSGSDPQLKDVPTPPDSWFTMMEQRNFESEREVEYYFVVPLLEQLGYEEDDFAIGYPVQMYEGVKKVHKEADFVLFNGSSRAKEDVLIIVEAKKLGRPITRDAIGQARSYALWLTPAYYLVTNGDTIRLYLFRGAIGDDVPVKTFERSDMQQHWNLLHETIGKAAAIERKQQLLKS
jgi:hypothetical protein